MKRAGLKNLTAATFTLLFFVCIGGLLKFLLVDDADSYTRVMLHELHHPKQNIDVLFVGSSHCYRSIVPELADEGFGAYTHNAGSGSQQMDGSLAMVREAFLTNDIKQVYLEVYHGMAQTAPNKSRSRLTGVWILSDYMYPTWRRASYIINASDPRFYMQGFVAARRSWSDIFRPSRLIGTADRKLKADYLTYAPPRAEDYGNGNIETYIERGYVATTGSLAEGAYLSDQVYGDIQVEKISEDYFKSLKSIAKLCRRKGAKLTLFIAPMPGVCTAGAGNYEEYKERLLYELKEFDVTLEDYNLCGAELFDTEDRSLFVDWGHLNNKGAERFTRLIADHAAGRLEDGIFFEDIEKKRESESPAIYGVMLNGDAADGERGNIAVTNRQDARIWAFYTPDGGERTPVGTQGGGGEFSLPETSKGEVEIEAEFPADNETLKIKFRYNTID